MIRGKDLRTGVENRNTQAVLDGALDPFIEASLKKGLKLGRNMTDSVSAPLKTKTN